MAKYTVKGSDETVVNVDVLGEQRSVGDVVELDEAVATPLVEEGKLEVFNDGEPSKEGSVDNTGGGQTGETV